MDYGPGVLQPAHGIEAQVILGALILGSVVVAGVALFGAAPRVSAGLLWFLVAVLPVTNLVVPAAILVAERTLYLPSVGVAILAGSAAAAVAVGRVRRPRRWAWAGGLALAFLAGRSLVRNPAWDSTFAALNTLAVEHPESWLAHRSRAQGLAMAGDTAAALAEDERAVQILPTHYALLLETALLHRARGDYARAEALSLRAQALAPRFTAAYEILSGTYLLAGRGRDAHRTALEGLTRARPTPLLWGHLSESYVLKGDLPAAIRAREAALGLDPTSVADRGRLAELRRAEADRGASGRGEGG